MPCRRRSFCASGDMFRIGLRLSGMRSLRRMRHQGDWTGWLPKRSRSTGLDAAPRFLPMESRAIRSFWDAYHSLPEPVQRAALKQYRLWLADPRHPSLHFKRVGRFWSARVNDDYRVVGVQDDDVIVWFFIGSHADYERLLKS